MLILQSKIAQALFEGVKVSSGIERLRKAFAIGFLKTCFEESPEMRKDLRVALQNLVSPPFTNLNYLASPTNFFLFQPSGEEEWQYHPPCGPLAHSTLLFPSIATSSIQFNPIFQLFAWRKYHLFGPIQADLPLPLQQRFFCAEWYAFARDVRSNYLPQFGAISLRIKESQVEVPASAIPSEVAYHLLAFIDFVDTLSLNLPAMDMVRGLNGEYAKCLIYQGIGDEVKAVEAARRLLVNFTSAQM